MTKDKNKRQCNYKVSSKTLDLRHQTQMKDFSESKLQLEFYMSDLKELKTKHDMLIKIEKKI